MRNELPCLSSARVFEFGMPFDELMACAQRFYDLAQVASNPVTKLQLVCLGDDYKHQANELRFAESLIELARSRRNKHPSAATRVLGGEF
jgi:hypothetical protein